MERHLRLQSKYLVHTQVQDNGADLTVNEIIGSLICNLFELIFKHLNHCKN